MGGGADTGGGLERRLKQNRTGLTCFEGRGGGREGGDPHDNKERGEVERENERATEHSCGASLGMCDECQHAFAYHQQVNKSQALCTVT